MPNFYENVLNWATARGLPKGAKAKRQRTKTWEELSELATGIAKSDLDAERLLAIKDAIGDCAVTTSNVATCMGLDSVKIGQQATEIAAARDDVFKLMDVDDLLNMFIVHQSIVKTGEDDKSHAFLPFVIHYEDQLAISLAALEVLTTRLGLVFADCQDYAWNEIKDRKGLMVNGTYIKEGDLSKTLQAIVDTALDNALEAYAPQFADDQTMALNDTWNAVRDQLYLALIDALNLDESHLGINADAATVTANIIIDAFEQFTITASRTVEYLKDTDEAAE